MKVTYQALWRWHFHAGLLCIPFVLVLALSGSVFLFKPQIDSFADRAVDSLAITGPRAGAMQHVAAALASLPGSKLFVYEVPREPDDAVRVHLYAPDGTGRIVYVHPQTLAILKTVPHAARLTEVMRTLHGELLAGRTGSILVELAASWAIIMLITGLYLWWPREARGAGGVFYPRLHQGRRVFWRDLHAVVGMWIASLALFLLVSALPWTPIWGAGFAELRTLSAPQTPQDWSAGRDAEHAGHRRALHAAALASPLGLDAIIDRIRPLRLEPPVRIYLPSAAQPSWRVRSETQNRPHVRELELDPSSGALLRERRFADKPLLDRVVEIGVAAHEGQLFGAANQALGLATALGLVTMCISALMLWTRRPKSGLGVPAPAVPGFRLSVPLRVGITVLGVLLPLLGVSLLVLWLLPKPRAASA